MSGKPYFSGVRMPTPTNTAAGSTFGGESSLPKLPVPTLEETLSRYLASVKPLVSESQFAKTQEAVHQFAASAQAQELQKRLIARRDETDSWLIDWWNDYAYFSYRDSVVLNVSYFFHLKDDLARKTPAARGASLIKAATEFKKMLVSETLPPDATKSGPFSMAMYQYMFNACRMPKEGSDFAAMYSSSDNNYVVVIRKDKFYKVELKENGEWLGVGAIESQLQQIIKDTTSSGPAIGALTSDNRDAWTQSRKDLVAADAKNEALLETIQAADFVLCLDDSKPVTRADVARGLWHGTGHSRWYDKSIQMIVFENGKAGFLCEHAMMDGTPTNRLANYIVDGIADKSIDLGASTPSSARPELLDFKVNEKTKKNIDAALHRLKEDVQRHTVSVLAYEGIGKANVKQYKCSPDAFVQMAMQLAYYKTLGKVPPTYESAATRRFKHGRTETARSVSDESVAFVKNWSNAQLSTEKRVEMAKKAIAAQSNYMAAALEGKGVDRHLLGLRLLLKPDEPKPAIFTDPSYAQSCHWNLSTSQVPADAYDGWGWGEVVPDGFGIAYILKDKSFHFNIASLKTMPNAEMHHYLQESLREMRDAFDQVHGVAQSQTVAPPKVKAKL